ncbi:MAG TPA: VanZ family protein [Nitrospira sp.]
MLIGLVLGYMGLLYFGAMIAPGVGVSGRLMVQMSPVFLDWTHAPGYGVLAWLLTRGLQRRDWPFVYALSAGCAAAFVFGMWTEIFQGSVPGRYPSTSDLTIDAVGVTVAAIVLCLLQMKRKSILIRRTYSSSVMQEAVVDDVSFR